MTLPFRLRVMHAITDALAEITPTNGYVSDLSPFDPGDGSPMARVFRGRAWFGDSDPLPMVSVLEGSSPAEIMAEEPYETQSEDYEVVMIVQGFVNDDKDNPTDPAYVLMADVRRRLAAERKRRLPAASGRNGIDPFGLWTADGKNRVIDIRVGPGVVRPADDLSSKAYFWLSLKVRMVDHADAPYA